MNAQELFRSGEQPGLEVGHPPDGLEVGHPPDGLEVYQHAQGLHPVPYEPYEDKNVYYETPTDTTWSPDVQEAPATTPKRSRKTLWIAVAVIAALVILAAILGGVLGSRAANHSSSSTTSSQDGGNTTALVNIRPNSRLAATGWHDDGNYRIRLFFQGPDQKLRFSSYASNVTTWDSPVVLTGLEHAAGNDTPLAAGLSLQSWPFQFNLIYLDQHFVMRGQGYQDYIGAAEQGSRLDLNDYPITVPSTSRLGSYWPYVMSQNSDGTIRWTNYQGSAASALWANSTLSVHGSTGTGIVVVPASTVFSNAGGFLYRNSDDSKLEAYLADRGNNETGLAWGTNLLSMDIPSNTTLGGFAVGRPDDSKNQTNTFALYQDNDGTIRVIWQDDDSGWKGPSTYAAFDGADNGTDIACVTAAAWAAAELLSNQVMNRCFFQVGGQVREVFYDGTNWQNKGFLPIT